MCWWKGGETGDFPRCLMDKQNIRASLKSSQFLKRLAFSFLSTRNWAWIVECDRQRGNYWAAAQGSFMALSPSSSFPLHAFHSFFPPSPLSSPSSLLSFSLLSFTPHFPPSSFYPYDTTSTVAPITDIWDHKVTSQGRTLKSCWI